MTHNGLIDTMLHTIACERATARHQLATRPPHARDTPSDSRFILSGLTGDQLEAVERYIASFRLST